MAHEAGASFADMRIVEIRQSRVYVRRRSLKLVDETESFGYGVRILLNGAWGFASNTRLEKDEVVNTARLAVETAKASSKVPKPAAARMAQEQPSSETLTGSCKVDPFTVPHQEKAELLLSACDRMLKVPEVAAAEGYLLDDDSIDALVKRAEKIAKRSPAHPEYMPPSGRRPIRQLPNGTIPMSLE